MAITSWPRRWSGKTAAQFPTWPNATCDWIERMVFISHIFHVFHDFALEICAEKPIILNTLNDLEIERMSDTTKSATRPLSPHLQVYRLPMTALMSISHRI